MRTIKKHDERKNEILDVAEMLFYSKGFERCTVNDILKEIGIAKGTFYHYFNSKEEALDAIVDRNIEMIINRIKKVISNPDIEPVEKLMRVFFAMRIYDNTNNDMLDDLHKPDNALLHQKNLSHLIKALAPILVDVIDEGIEKNTWRCRYPLQYMQIFLAAALTLTDEGIFEVEADSQMITMAALIAMLEKMLEVPEDSFLKLYLQNLDNQ